MRAATWNVLTLTPPGYSNLLSAELTRLGITIAGLQEVRWKGSGEIDCDNYKIMWSGNDHHHTQGVALAIERKFASSITIWKALGPRLMYARLKHSQGFLSIFTCYAPTEVSSEE